MKLRGSNKNQTTKGRNGENVPQLQITEVILVFFLSRFSFSDTDNSQDSRRKEGTIFYSTLPLPLAYEHSDI